MSTFLQLAWVCLTGNDALKLRRLWKNCYRAKAKHPLSNISRLMRSWGKLLILWVRSCGLLWSILTLWNPKWMSIYEAQSNYHKTIINSIWWPIYIINSVDKNKLSRYTTHWCSTTETYSLHYEVHLSVVMFELKWRHQTAKCGWWKIFSNP